MTLNRNRPLVTATISVAALSMLAACGTRPSLGTLEGGLAETDYHPMTSPRKIVDRCMQNRGYEILNDEGKGM